MKINQETQLKIVLVVFLIILIGSLFYSHSKNIAIKKVMDDFNKGNDIHCISNGNKIILNKQFGWEMDEKKFYNKDKFVYKNECLI